MPNDGNLVVVEGLHLSRVQVRVPVHDGRNGGAGELSPLDPFVVVDFVLDIKPVLPSSSAARRGARQEKSSAAHTSAQARSIAGSSSSLHKFTLALPG